MAQATPQNFANHARLVPTYHFVTFPILAINLLWSLYRVIFHFSTDVAFQFLLAVAFVLLFFNARIFALTVQDRLIRLEMTLLMEKLLPASLRPRIQDFTPAQLVSLRFASDAELPELAAKVLADNITERKAIKRMIKNWKPDYLRA